MRLAVRRGRALHGAFRPPSDKSLTHRAYMLGAIASGPSEVRSPLRGEDCESTLHCLGQMGLRWEEQPQGLKLIPAREWGAPASELDCGNSGTTMRLLSGLIASRPMTATLTGDASLSRRPMGRIALPLRQMGARFEPDAEAFTPPFTVHGGSLRAIDYVLPTASAQVKSAILLAGLRAEGTTRVREPSPTRDHTERMLRAMGVPVANGEWIEVEGGAQPHPFSMTIPGDISSAAFFMVLAALATGSVIQVRELGTNPTRTGLLDVFTQVGVPVEPLGPERDELGEPAADLAIRSAADLRPFTIVGPLVPRLIDEIPVLAVLATQCQGVSVIRDARELRVKESDRIELVASGLRSMGARVETFEDGLAIEGPTPLHGALIEAQGDHRIAMAFAVAGWIAEGETAIEGAESIATSFPSFESELARLGGA